MFDDKASHNVLVHSVCSVLVCLQSCMSPNFSYVAFL